MNIYRGSNHITPETRVVCVTDKIQEIPEEKEIMINIGNKISITLKESYFNELIVKADQFLYEFNNGLNMLNDTMQDTRQDTRQNTIQDTIQNTMQDTIQNTMQNDINMPH